MNNPLALFNCEEAKCFIEKIADPVTKNLTSMAFIHFISKVHLEQRDLPAAKLDMLFIATTLGEFFAEHNVLLRTLEGETVGAMFEDGLGCSTANSVANPTRAPSTIRSGS